jgi:dTDP-4-dehydrorhamnose 3,5-epimerase
LIFGQTTFGKWFGVDLTAENRLMIYVPRGFAYGILTLVDDTEAFYMVGEFCSPESERGIRFSDSTFGMAWPRETIEVLLSIAIGSNSI